MVSLVELDQLSTKALFMFILLNGAKMTCINNSTRRPQAHTSLYSAASIALQVSFCMLLNFNREKIGLYFHWHVIIMVPRLLFRLKLKCKIKRSVC